MNFDDLDLETAKTLIVEISELNTDVVTMAIARINLRSTTEALVAANDEIASLKALIEKDDKVSATEDIQEEELDVEQDA